MLKVESMTRRAFCGFKRATGLGHWLLMPRDPLKGLRGLGNAGQCWAMRGNAGQYRATLNNGHGTQQGLTALNPTWPLAWVDTEERLWRCLDQSVAQSVGKL